MVRLTDAERERLITLRMGDTRDLLESLIAMAQGLIGTGSRQVEVFSAIGHMLTHRDHVTAVEIAAAAVLDLAQAAHQADTSATGQTVARSTGSKVTST